MGTEIELKLQLSPATARALGTHPALAGAPTRRRVLLNTYYDTPDLALTARRIAVRFRKQGSDWLLTVKSAEPALGGLAMRSEWEYPATPGTFDFSPVTDDALRDFLTERQAALIPIFTTDFRRTAWQVTRGDSRIEVALDQGHIESQGRRDRISEVELELVEGAVDDLLALARALQADHVLRPMPHSKAERGYALYHDTPARPARGRLPALTATGSATLALRGIALSALEHFQRNHAGLGDGSDPEYVHQARVALRRLRAALRLFAPALPEGFADLWGGRWRALGNALGELRNLDVQRTSLLPKLVAAFPEQGEPARRLARAGRQAAAARRALLAELAGGDDARLAVDFMAALFALPEDGPSVAEVARERLKHRAKVVRRLARQVAEMDAEARHALRIEIKKLRYALDFCAPLWPGDRMTRYQHALARLQTVLGKINDLATLETALRAEPGPAGLTLGWVAGRHALLVSQLPAELATWRALRLPKLR